MIKASRPGVLAGVLALAVLPCAGLALGNSGNGSGAYATGQYRNLFAVDGHSERAIDSKIDAE